MTAIQGTVSSDRFAPARREEQAQQAAQARETKAQESRQQVETDRKDVPRETERREARKIPGLGNAVDITA
jgi:antitoxin component of MazEF toxin-antitoxin module